MARLIGLTGGIATGKSTVARLLAARGAVVVDADALAREVVEPGRPALAEIAAEFGPGVVGGNGRLERSALAAIVFAHADRRRRLEAITHPRIRELMAGRIADALAGGAPLVVADIPLLFEQRPGAATHAGGGAVGLNPTGESRGAGPPVGGAGFDGVMVVWCDAVTELARLVERDGISRQDAERRLAAQMPIDEKRERATWVVDNSGTPAQTEAQVVAWWRREIATSP